jgi:SsrA-binding protein
MAPPRGRPPAIKAKVVAENRRARHEYSIEDVYEAGIVLAGTEVKALRLGQGSIAESYAEVAGDEVWLINAHIPPYSNASHFTHEPRRARKLLLNTREISKLHGAVARQGMTLVPLSIYFNPKGRAKLELALARGRKLHAKREAARERDWQPEQGRLLRDRG